MTERLRLEQLSIGYREPLTEPLTWSIAAGEIVAVLGASGSGKSTLLATIAGVTPPLSGRILVDGRDVSNTAIQQRGVGIVFQEPLLFPHLDCAGNVAYGLRRHGTTRRAAQAQASELLAWVGLAGYEHRPVRELSGGQAQRVSVARALAPQPGVMLLDEPFSALDVDLRSRLVQDVRRMLRDRDCSTIYVTHDPGEAEAIADRVERLPIRT